MPQSALFEHTVVPFAQVFLSQSPPVSGQSPADVHAVVPLLHKPFVPGQVAALAHTANGELLQLPGQSMFRRHAALPFLQFPDAGHPKSLTQDWPVLLQAPLTTAQSLASEQSLLSTLHWPMGPHSPGSPQHAAWLMLHAPASVGQAVLALAAVQLA